MWTRGELKSKAKDFLRKFYWKAFVVALIITIVTSGGTTNGSNHNKSVNNGTGFQLDAPFSTDGDSFFQGIQLNDSMGNAITDNMPMMWGVIFGLGGAIVLLAISIAIGFKVFIGAPLEVGGRSFFSKGAESDEEVHFAHLGMAFRGNHYMNVVWAMFYRGFLNFLFYLLLIIPGIIKAYSYSMVPYLLADNPSMDAKRAIQVSEDMTNGQKMEMFILDLSFIGWYILGALLFGIGIFFVHPYAYATKAQLYLTLKAEALKTGICSATELSRTDAYTTI